MEHFKKAIEIQPDYAKPYANLGIVYTTIHNPDAAIAAYRQAIDALSKAKAANRNFAPAYLNLSKVYLTLKQYPLAIEYAAQAKSLGLPTRSRTAP